MPCLVRYILTRSERHSHLRAIPDVLMSAYRCESGPASRWASGVVRQDLRERGHGRAISVGRYPPARSICALPWQVDTPPLPCAVDTLHPEFLAIQARLHNSDGQADASIGSGRYNVIFGDWNSRAKGHQLHRNVTNSGTNRPKSNVIAPHRSNGPTYGGSLN